MLKLKKLIMLLIIGMFLIPIINLHAYTPPANNRVKLNFNHDWKFIKQNLKGSGINPEVTGYNDTAWSNVNLPHTWNDIDRWREWCSTRNDSPVESTYFGKAWYRKHFTLSSSYSGRKVILEFQGIDRCAEFWVNGTWIGRHENGVSAAGLDITNNVVFGADNVIAIEVNNDNNFKPIEYGSTVGLPYGQPFNLNLGGLNQDAFIHITDKVYQTLPIYRNLGTLGTYVYAQSINTLAKTANITIQAEVKNDNTSSQSVSFEAVVVDRNSNTVFTKTGTTQAIAAGQKYTFTVTNAMTGIHLWAPDYPYLYKVYTILKLGTTVIDVYETPLGVRKIGFNPVEGLEVNGRQVFLKGYAPRVPHDWPCMGIPPDWMGEYDFKLMKENLGNFIRPMHSGPPALHVDAADKFGIIFALPSANNEGDSADATTWQMRLDIMRDLTIYFRNNPSVMFWEASNSGISYEHMSQMIDIRQQYDPYGGRFAGTRDSSDSYPEKEYGSTMDGVDNSTLMPVWDAEYARGECSRRVWDEVTPTLDYDVNQFVTGGYFAVASEYHKSLGLDTGGDSIAHYTLEGYFRLQSSEDMVMENLAKYYSRYMRSAFLYPIGDRVTQGVMVGGAKILFTDSTTDGRMRDMEVARVTGLLDGSRIPKEVYHALTVAHNDNPQVYVVGHWNHVANTRKIIYVASNTAFVKLITYDTNNVATDWGYGLTGDSVSPPAIDQQNRYVFKFDNVLWKSGRIKAIGYDAVGAEVATHEKHTIGAASKIKLTNIVGPSGFRADGSDVAMVEFEVVDANGERCPTAEKLINFTCSGQGQFLGGYNGGRRWSTNKDNLTSGYSLYTEAGVNRVFVRATRTAGTFTLTATCSGLTQATTNITSTAFSVTNGITTTMPQKYTVALGTEPAPVQDIDPTAGPTPVPTPPSNDVIVNFAYSGAHPGAQVIKNAQNGMQIYMDDAATFAGLPSYLIGGEYVRAYQSDSSEYSSTDQYQMNVSRYCYIYQLIDSVNAMPAHNDNSTYQWVLMPETVSIKGRTMKIYRSRMMAPADIGYFATNGHGVTPFTTPCNMYLVFAVNQEYILTVPSDTVTASSTQSPNNPNLIIDGNDQSTRWGAADGTLPQWIKIDLGSVCSIGGYETYWLDFATRYYKYKIELSDDDNTYTMSVDKTGNTFKGVGYDRTNSLFDRTGRYIKLTVTGTSGGWASLYEMKVSGISSSTNPAPSVSITAPANGATYTAPASVTINATASDSNGSVTKVDFYQGTTLLGTDTSSPYSYSWTGVAAGTYSLTAKATDNGGAVTTSGAVSITVNPAGGNVSPTVSITSPANGATFTAPASVTINANAADSDGTIANVAFYQGTTLLNTDTTSPYSYTWGSVAAGSYSLTARATDNLGAVTTSAAIGIVVNPAGGGTLLSQGKTATASSFLGGNTAAMAVDGNMGTRWESTHGVDPSWIYVDLGATCTISQVILEWEGAYATAYQIETAASSSGPWTSIYSTTTGNGGNDTLAVSGSGRYVRMNGTVRALAYGYSLYEFKVYGTAGGNVAPTASITSPANGATFTAPASVTINANASDSDGTIANVAFYQGSTLLSTDTTSPYSYTWTGVAAGTYSLTARATDNGGAVTTSTAVGITVNAAGNVSPTVSITAPANGATYTAPASVTINANAADSDGTIANVAFYQGSTLLSTDTTSPYSYTWGSVAAGTYSLTARATDNGGAVTTSAAIGITVNGGGAAAPTYQALGSAVNGTGAITVAWPAHQANDVALLVVETANQAVTLSTPAGFAAVTNSPQSTGTAGGTAATRLTVFWKRATTSAEASAVVADSGDHQDARIITFRGVVASGNPWDVTAGNTAAASTSVSIPGATTTVANTLVVAIVANATDTTSSRTSAWANASLASITERMDSNTTQGNGGGIGIGVGVKATAGAYSATTATLATSSVQARMSIALKPTSGGGNVAPTVSITSPANGATFTAPASVTINANAADSDGTIANVAFYQGATLLSTDTTSPYSYAWTNVAAGTYSLTARATDNLGAVTTSAAIGITVNGGGGAVLLSQGKTATASTFQAGNEVAKANDGSTTTRWGASDGVYPQWWRVDLGASYSLSRMDIVWYGGTGRSYKYKIETSPDDITYTQRIDQTGRTATGDSSDSFTTTARYVRVTVTGSSAGWASAYEFKVYGN